MSDDLQRLLEAWDRKLNSAPSERVQSNATFARLFADALAKRPGTDQTTLLWAVKDRYRDFLKARRQPPTLPPTA